MSHLAQQLEHFSVFLAVIGVVLLPLNFVIAHHLQQPFETRFLLSGGMLLSVALYLRFLVTQIGPLQRAVYRVATTMAMWSLGFYFVPYAEVILYLVLAPAVFFLFRIEIKGAAATDEDIIAAGVLLALTAVLYSQHQALQVLLFHDANFDWASFYHNAPIMILVGIGFVRLQKHAVWHGLAFLGMLCLLSGTILSVALALGTVQVAVAEAWIAALCAHGMAAALVLEHRLARGVQHFAGLEHTEWEAFRRQTYGLAIVLLHLAAVHALRQVPLVVWSVPVLLLCTLSWLYRLRQLSVSLTFIESAVWLYPVLFWCAPHTPFVVFPVALSVPLLITLALRRSTAFPTLIPNATFMILSLLYAAVIVHRSQLDLWAFTFTLWLLLLWSALPERPMTVAPRYHHLFWPVLSGFYLVCQHGRFATAMLPLWAVSILLPVLLCAACLRIPACSQFVAQHPWPVVQHGCSMATTLCCISPCSLIAPGSLASYSCQRPLRRAVGK